MMILLPEYKQGNDKQIIPDQNKKKRICLVTWAKDQTFQYYITLIYMDYVHT